MLAEVIAENCRQESGMANVRFIATPVLNGISGECNWRVAIVSSSTDEQRRIVDWAATILQLNWDMLERRKLPRG
jgi:hypothetical protein